METLSNLFSDRRFKLFFASFLALYFELVIIRYLSSEIREFAYLKNLPLVASFFGLGLGMVLGKKEKLFSFLFPFSAIALFSLIHWAPSLGLTHIPFPAADYVIWGNGAASMQNPFIRLLLYVGIVSLISALVVFFCIPLGSRIGSLLSEMPPLKGYFFDLSGSIAGIAAFTAISFFDTPPWLWLAIGFVPLMIFYRKNQVAVVAFATLCGIIALTASPALWSPYYRITLENGNILPGETEPSVRYLSVNYDYHQKILDLSDTFFAKHPGAEPNTSAKITYDFPYLANPVAKNVLILGAGTGNDVASALRHGAQHVDAVEIDPVILDLGRKYHPEHPYDSPRVTTHLDDARAFLSQTKNKYDLIVFAYLDSHTLLASSSSLRLDNYVYTEESLSEARKLLEPQGTMVLAFGAGTTFVGSRLYHMLDDVFNSPPKAYFTNYDGGGVVFVSGQQAESPQLASIPVINAELEKNPYGGIVATDNWPFLYLRDRTFPVSYSIVFILVILAWLFSWKSLEMESVSTFENLHFFALGAAFMLLETRAVTELSLLLGSTWIVNTVAIIAFLAMAVTANFLLMRSDPPRKLIYSLLFASLALSIFFPLHLLSSLPMASKVIGGGIILSLPVFFSGMLFSRAFRSTTRPGQALGINLLGALIGGVAENTVMIGGTMLLGALAVLFYLISLIGVAKNFLAKN
jgi:spermidine synthase